MRLDQYVAQYWPEYSRSVWQKYIEAGYVHVNGVVETSPKKLLGEDDEVTTHVPEATDYSDHELPVIYEDGDVIVINKPSGVLTHSKGAVNEEFTVADFVKGKMSEPDDTNRPGIVHRLDRATSGVLIAAKHSAAKHHFQKQFQDRKAKKEYIAIVHGVPPQKKATISVPIGRNPKEPSQFRVDARGKEATTFVELLHTNGTLSIVSLKPHTGRTHQLRIHMNYYGVPIVGDTLYGGGNPLSSGPINRLALHARSLEITLPNKHRETFVAEPPADFQALIEEVSRG